MLYSLAETLWYLNFSYLFSLFLILLHQFAVNFILNLTMYGKLWITLIFFWSRTLKYISLQLNIYKMHFLYTPTFFIKNKFIVSSLNSRIAISILQRSSLIDIDSNLMVIIPGRLWEWGCASHVFIFFRDKKFTVGSSIIIRSCTIKDFENQYITIADTKLRSFFNVSVIYCDTDFFVCNQPKPAESM